MARFARFERADQTTGLFSSGCEVLRREEDARLVVGAGFPEASASVLRMGHAALSGNGKSWVSAGIRGALAFSAAAKRMRRPVESCGSAAPQEAVYADLLSEDENEKIFREGGGYRRKKGENKG